MRKIILTVIIVIVNICPANAGKTLLSVARAELGHREIGSNNRGKWVEKYLRCKKDWPWCAGFVSYCIAEAGTSVRYTLRARDFLKLGKLVKQPQPEDIIVFSRSNGCGHVGIVETVTPDKIITIEGNTGDYPSVVKRITYDRRNIKNLLGFVRIK